MKVLRIIILFFAGASPATTFIECPIDVVAGLARANLNIQRIADERCQMLNRKHQFPPHFVTVVFLRPKDFTK